MLLQQLNNMEDQELNKKIDARIRQQLQSGLFNARKLTDTPTDDLMVTPRKYVNLNGTTAQRPTSSIVGQFFFDNTLGRPIWWDGVSFVDADGNVI